MMRKYLSSLKLNTRQKVMLGITATLVLTAMILENWTFPAYDEWRMQETAVAAQANTYNRLVRNLAIKDRVESQFATIPPEGFRTASDEIMFCDFLKRIEMAAGPLLVKVTPAPAEDEGAFATYQVRILLAGKLQDIVQFVDSLMHGSDVVGMESFSLRAIQGRNMCECTFILWMVRLSEPAGRAAGGNNTVVRDGTRVTM